MLGLIACIIPVSAGPGQGPSAWMGLCLQDRPVTQRSPWAGWAGGGDSLSLWGTATPVLRGDAVLGDKESPALQLDAPPHSLGLPQGRQGRGALREMPWWACMRPACLLHVGMATAARPGVVSVPKGWRPGRAWWASAPGHRRTAVRMSARRGSCLKVQPRGTCFQTYMIVAGTSLLATLSPATRTCPTQRFLQKQAGRGTSLAVQRLRVQAPNAGGIGLILGQGTRIPQAT